MAPTPFLGGKIMATYTPAALVQVVALTSTTSTTQKYSAANGTTGIIRTLIFNQATAGTQAFFVSLGADAAGTRIFSNVATTVNVPSIYNGWWVTATNSADAINIMASTTSTTNLTGQVSGYTY